MEDVVAPGDGLGPAVVPGQVRGQDGEPLTGVDPGGDRVAHLLLTA